MMIIKNQYSENKMRNKIQQTLLYLMLILIPWIFWQLNREYKTYVQNECVQGKMEQGNDMMMDCLGCVSVEDWKSTFYIQTQTDNQDKSIFYAVWSQKECYQYECQQYLFVNDFYAKQPENQAVVQAGGFQFMGGGTTQSSISLNAQSLHFRQSNSLQFWFPPLVQASQQILIRFRYLSNQPIKPSTWIEKPKYQLSLSLLLGLFSAIPSLFFRKYLVALIILFSWVSPPLFTILALLLLAYHHPTQIITLVLYIIGVILYIPLSYLSFIFICAYSTYKQQTLFARLISALLYLVIFLISPSKSCFLILASGYIFLEEDDRQGYQTIKKPGFLELEQTQFQMEN